MNKETINYKDILTDSKNNNYQDINNSNILFTLKICVSRLQSVLFNKEFDVYAYNWFQINYANTPDKSINTKWFQRMTVIGQPTSPTHNPLHKNYLSIIASIKKFINESKNMMQTDNLTQRECTTIKCCFMGIEETLFHTKFDHKAYNWFVTNSEPTIFIPQKVDEKQELSQPIIEEDITKSSQEISQPTLPIIYDMDKVKPIINNQDLCGYIPKCDFIEVDINEYGYGSKVLTASLRCNYYDNVDNVRFAFIDGSAYLLDLNLIPSLKDKILKSINNTQSAIVEIDDSYLKKQFSNKISSIQFHVVNSLNQEIGPIKQNFKRSFYIILTTLDLFDPVWQFRGQNCYYIARSCCFLPCLPCWMVGAIARNYFIFLNNNEISLLKVIFREFDQFDNP
jgi:hypothetical protein